MYVRRVAYSAFDINVRQWKYLRRGALYEIRRRFLRVRRYNRYGDFYDNKRKQKNNFTEKWKIIIDREENFLIMIYS